MVSRNKRSRIVVSLMITAFMLVLLPAMAFAASESITGDTRTNMFAHETYPAFDPNNPTFLYPQTLAGGVWDYFPSTQASGTGVFNTYLAIQAKGNNDEERGFNTGGNVADFDEGDSKTSALPLTAVPLVTIGGTAYREFAVDINEVSGIPSQYLSTEVLQIWKSSNNNLGGQYSMVTHTFNTAEPKLIYDLDGGFNNGVHSEPAENRTVILDYGVNTGSGKPDYKVYVPAAWFGDNTGYAVMVVVHGVLGSELTGRDSSDGFEEWGVRVVGTATKTGVKFEDLDADGQPREVGEPGLEGWTIFVDYNDNGVLDPGEPSGDTGPDGSYTINGITPGTFKVREVQKAGWTQSYPALGYHQETFVSGVLYPNNDFGNWRYATKSGMKFEDLNGNGMKDSGEPGVPDLRIDRYTVSATDVLTFADFAMTDANGAYSFTDMVPGVRYFIAEALPAGWTQSYPNSSTGGDASNAFAGKGYGWDVTLASGETDSGNNFGNWRYATKSGMKFEDMNGNGAKDDDEPGVEDWRIDRYKVVGDTLVADGSTMTDETGAYSFTNMVPGVRYFIAEELRSGWTQSFPHGSTGGDASNAYADKGYGWDITLDSNETDSGNNFGNWRYATKSGMKFEDMNADGDKDAGDDGLEGWTINRYKVVDGSLVADGSTTTNATGAYSFTDMVPGVRYFIAEAHPDGWMQSYPNSSTGGDASNAFAGKGYGWDITLDSNETDSGNDFGNWQYATKSGMKFEDLNGNGAKDDDEPGVEDWRIDRYTVDDEDNLTLHDSTYTDENGAYSFDDMMPDVRYFIAEELRSGWTQSFPHGTTGGDATNAFAGKGYGWDVTLASGEADTGNNFGNWRYATKSGMKFEDMNADGDKDAGDDGLEGWTIYRYRVIDDALVEDGSTLTDENGAYSFDDMVPGVRYFISEELRSGWTQSFPNDETGGDASDVFAGKGFGWDVTLDSNETDSGNDFGNWQYATKSGFKFMDENGDGFFDDTEMGLSGWTIQLWTGTPGDLTLVDSDLTDANGFYSFDMIHPGVTYYVSEVIPDPAWIQTFPNGTTDGAVYLAGLGYAWEINLTSGEEHENNNFGNTYYHDETAWAYDGNPGGKPVPFTSIENKPKFTNWGWTNGPYTLADIGDGYTLDLYAGAGNNVLDNGELVGHVELSVNLDGDLVVHYTILGSNVLDDIHLWVGSTPLPKIKGKFTNAPGQFPYAMSDFTADGSGGYTITIEDPPANFFIAAHAVVRMYETP